MKPFDLKAALAGHPVITRSGRKAYVRHYEQELEMIFPLIGYIVGSFMTLYLTTWTLNGKALTTFESGADIVGMWVEPLTFDHWDAIDEKWKFIAEDNNGERYLYTVRPTPSASGYIGWAVDDHSVEGSYCPASVFKWDTRGRDWKDTLVERPKK